jgi:hypothetical protein
MTLPRLRSRPSSRDPLRVINDLNAIDMTLHIVLSEVEVPEEGGVGEDDSAEDLGLPRRS